MCEILLGLAILLATVDVAGNQAPQKLYVANSAGNDIHVVDTATNRVIKRVEVGPQPHGLAATAAGDQLFITVENTQGRRR
jgi:YVTN family beta-propeller protein